MKRILIPMICFLVLSVGGVFLYLHARRYDVVITQAQIDDALKAQFPVTKTYLLLFRITYSNPKVRLVPDSNRIEVTLDTDLGIKFGGQPKGFGGSAVVNTGVAYQREKHEFLLSEREIVKLTVQSIPQEYVDGVTQFASNTAREYLQQYPIYTLESGDMKSSATRLLLKKVEVKSGRVHAILGL